ncbi:MAG: CDP-alcohol phosphatidyltransferase family protein [Bacteroides sp.]|nr:CDP-alcohol phosphatidyltransferase family protein [Bacteroides sp.]
MKNSLKEKYRRSLKSLDTEEHIDLFFYRPIGYCWAEISARLGISPNALTIVAIILGISAGVLFYYPELRINVIGMLLLVLANTFDSADGQLARLTKQYSRIGRILDGLCGDLWFITIYFAIIFREINFSDFFSTHPWAIWLLACTAGICHTKQAAMADYYRQFHLYFLKGNALNELESADQLEKQLEESGITWSNNFWKRLTMTFYLGYTRQQEATAPHMQDLRRELHRRYPDGNIPADFYDDVRSRSLPLMKYTNILSFNWRVITLFITLFIGQPWLYFVAELTVFNGILIYLVVTHERHCKALVRELDSHYSPQ